MDSLFRKVAVERSGVRIGVCMAHTGVSFGAPSGMGPSSVAVDFDGKSGPRLLLGAHVRLDVAGAGVPLHVPARVASRAVSRDRLRYDFAFESEALTGVLEALSRRADAEAAPLGDDHVVEVVGEEGLRFSARLLELSTAGAVLHVHSPYDRWVAPGESVTLHLVFPVRSDAVLPVRSDAVLPPVRSDAVLPVRSDAVLPVRSDAVPSVLSDSAHSVHVAVGLAVSPADSRTALPCLVLSNEPAADGALVAVALRDAELTASVRTGLEAFVHAQVRDCVEVFAG